MKQKKAIQKLNRSLIFVSSILLALLFAYPIFVAFISAFKTNGEIMRSPLSLPETWTLDNFRFLFAETRFLEAFMNSTILTIVSVVMMVILIPMAAYGIVRDKSKFSKWVYIYFLAGMMVPFQAYMIPLFKQLKDMYLFGNLAGPILIYVSGSVGFGVLLYTSFLKGVPYELEEAAAIDGASTWTTYWKIIFPLLSPTTASFVVLNGISVWNDFLMPMMVLPSDKAKTINVEIFQFVDQFASRWDVVFAGTVCAIVPILIIFLMLQKYFVKGVTSGSIK